MQLEQATKDLFIQFALTQIESNKAVVEQATKLGIPQDAAAKAATLAQSYAVVAEDLMSVAG